MSIRDEPNRRPPPSVRLYLPGRPPPAVRLTEFYLPGRPPPSVRLTVPSRPSTTICKTYGILPSRPSTTICRPPPSVRSTFQAVHHHLFLGRPPPGPPPSVRLTVPSRPSTTICKTEFYLPGEASGRPPPSKIFQGPPPSYLPGRPPPSVRLTEFYLPGRPPPSVRLTEFYLPLLLSTLTSELPQQLVSVAPPPYQSTEFPSLPYSVAMAKAR
ncbi:uncharacterized protein [Macrobrachium rosenbergii]|uniref:uncharacterized protein n=1 Tax=Macrobrachium rosenbergii TaxID=79674 RepID=UPI0034D5FE69